MQTKSLSMKKAMSAALFVLLLVVAGTKNALAQNQVAVCGITTMMPLFIA